MVAIVLFDGVCNFCDASVNFIIEHDREGVFGFAPLQSDVGKQLLAEYGLRSSGDEPPAGDEVTLDSIILIENGTAYTHSTAALRILKHLPYPWRLLYGLMIVPRPIRDFFYRLFAKHRYRFFGQKDECMVPTAEVRARFL